MRQEICKLLTDSVICRFFSFAMPDNVGINRQLNRQQWSRHTRTAEPQVVRRLYIAVKHGSHMNRRDFLGDALVPLMAGGLAPRILVVEEVRRILKKYGRGK